LGYFFLATLPFVVVAALADHSAPGRLDAAPPVAVVAAQEQPKPLKLLFFGDKSGHQPEARYRQVEKVLRDRGMDIEFVGNVSAINAKTLARYDGLILYTNTPKITPEQEKDLLDYVEGGKGLIVLHCASYAFQNSPKYIALVGAQFKSHGTGTFRTTIVEPDHPIMKGYKGFESWDETYVHTKHNEKDRTVLEYRVDDKVKEPWTWVRTQGKGRVFYTAWGHDQRTWSNPGFHELVERGIRWAVGTDPTPQAVKPVEVPKSAYDRAFKTPEMTTVAKDPKPFEYKDVGNQIPNYKGGKGATLNLQQQPVPPEESMKHMVTPKGFHVEFVVGDPDIHRPIFTAWDEQGRLWIAESQDYPHTLQASGNGKGRDRIIICEDTKGTGRMDKITVFADQLSIPAGFTFYKGGVIVFEGRKTVYLKDTKGTGKADYRKELMGTWAQGDTHGGVSNMQYGLDNWIWAMQGYNNSTVTDGSGATHTFRQGFFRFTPDGKHLEFIRPTNNNTWGLGFSEEGLVFGSTANGNPSVYVPIPNRYYESVRGWTVKGLDKNGIAGNPKFRPITDKVRQVDFFGAYTAAAGHALYTARTYPQEYWNRTAFVNEPTGHLVGTFVLTRDGAQFRSTNPFNLFASNDEWTSPIRSEVGPDGNVWVTDWYSFIIQHNPTPPGFKTGVGAAYSTELRNSNYGRIYRIVPDNYKAPAERMTLKDATPEKLVATLKHDNRFWRIHAQRLLVERGKQDVVPELIKLIRDQSFDEIGLNCGAIHALWTLHGLGALNTVTGDATATAFAALRHPSPGVRLNAVQALPRDPQSITAIVDAGLLNDADANVRLAAMLAMADQPPQKTNAGQAIIDALAKSGNDKLITDAATAAAARHSVEFLTALAEQKKPNDKMLSIALIVSEHYARGRPVDSIKVVIAKLADADPAVIEPVVRGLAKGWPKDSKPALDAQFEKDLARLATRLPKANQGTVAQLAASWGSKQFSSIVAESASALLAKVKNEKLSAEERASAARELLEADARDKKVLDAILEQINARTEPAVSIGLLQALQASEGPEVGQRIADQVPELTPAVRSAALGVLLSRPEWTTIFLDLVEKGKLRFGDLSLDQKQALAGHPNAKIKERAVALMKTRDALPNADRQKVIDTLLSVKNDKGESALLHDKGDAAAGKLIFKNTCSKCHVHSGEGTQIGPDLTGMAVHTKEHLLTEIMDPSRSVEGNFKAWTLVKTNGQVLNGLLASESKTTVELYDAEGKKQVILRQDIDVLKETNKSLMPDGFETQLNHKQIADLLEFLTTREFGKYLPLPLDRIANIVSTKGMFNAETSKTERMVLKDWKATRMVEGVPFQVIDPQGDTKPNMVLLYGPQGSKAPKMPKSVSLSLNAPAKAIHLLSGVSGYGYPYTQDKTVSMIVKLHYKDGTVEEHKLMNGEHFADYIKRNDVPGSKFAFLFEGKQQARYLSIQPKGMGVIDRIEFVHGGDQTAPVIIALTLELHE
jgi:putative membrane-bound dehydrogenase-like protein